MRPRGEATRWLVQCLSKVAVLAVATSTSLVCAQQDGPYEGESYEDYRQRVFDEAILPTENNRNAALIYQQAFREMVLVGQELEESWPEVLERIETAPGPDAYRTPAVAALLDKTAHVLEMVHRAAKLEDAEFGLNLDRGFESMLPHMGSMRHLTSLMSVQAHAQRAHGRPGDASQTMADMLRLSRHASSDGILIGSLIGARCASEAFDSIDDAIARGELEASSAQTILSGLDADTEDPYSFLDAVNSEYEMLLTSVDSFDDPGPELADLLDSFQDSENEESDMLRGLDAEGTNALIDQMRPGYELAELAFMEKDPKKARALIAEVEAGLQNGEYGPLADLIMTNFDTALEAKIHAEERIAKYERTLRAIASGEDPAKFANAAILYAQAFPYLAQISEQNQEMLDLIRRVVTVTGSCDALPEAMLDEIRAALEEAAPVLGLLHTAARFEKCEWKEDVFAERRGRIIAEAEWVRPMRAAVRLLLADAALTMCLAQAEGIDAHRALSRSLADALAVAIHLGDGSHLLASTVAAASIMEVSDLAATAATADLIDGSAADLFESRFSRLEGSDPLGWRAAREAMLRPSLYEIVMHYGLSDPLDAERLARNWSGERLAALAYFQHLRNEETSDGEPSFAIRSRRGDLFAIDDIIDMSPEDLQRLNADHARLIELLSAIDTVKPIDTTIWQARGGESIEHFEKTIDTLEKASRDSK